MRRWLKLFVKFFGSFFAGAIVGRLILDGYYVAAFGVVAVFVLGIVTGRVIARQRRARKRRQAEAKRSPAHRQLRELVESLSQRAKLFTVPDSPFMISPWQSEDTCFILRSDSTAMEDARIFPGVPQVRIAEIFCSLPADEYVRHTLLGSRVIFTDGDFKWLEDDEAGSANILSALKNSNAAIVSDDELKELIEQMQRLEPFQ